MKTAEFNFTDVSLFCGGNACPVNTVSALIENIIRPRMDEYRRAA